MPKASLPASGSTECASRWLAGWDMVGGGGFREETESKGWPRQQSCILDSIPVTLPRVPPGSPRTYTGSLAVASLKKCIGSQKACPKISKNILYLQLAFWFPPPITCSAATICAAACYGVAGDRMGLLVQSKSSGFKALSPQSTLVILPV